MNAESLNVRKPEKRKANDRKEETKKGYNLLNLCSSYSHFLSTHMLLQSRVLCAPSFLYFPQTSLRCCGLSASSPGLRFWQARMTLARRAFHGFEIGVANVCTSCRSRPELSNENLVFTKSCKFGVDTAENGPLRVSQKLANS